MCDVCWCVVHNVLCVMCVGVWCITFLFVVYYVWCVLVCSVLCVVCVGV